MIAKNYEALLLDLDGTLLDDSSRVRPRVRDSILAAVDAGVRVVFVTGRSELGTDVVVEEVGYHEVCVVFNGAAVYCPRQRVFLEERTLSDRTAERALELAREGGYQVLVQRAGAKFASEPRTEIERATVAQLEGLSFVDGWDLPLERALRVTLFSNTHASSADFCSEVERHVDQPIYTTHFPLNALATHRSSVLQVVDVHPPCQGKAEAFRMIEERFGIPPERTVAVGDASNDVPMLERAGLGVAMGSGMLEAREAANRVIGSNETDAIAELVSELFGVRCA